MRRENSSPQERGVSNRKAVSDMAIQPAEAFAVRWLALCRRYPELALHETPRLSYAELRMLCEEFYRRGAIDAPKLDPLAVERVK